MLEVANISAAKISVFVPEYDYEVTLRFGSSDIAAFQQIYVDREYASNNLPLRASVIVDLGANIGLATVYFGLLYPEARILAVEPEAENFALLQLNASHLGARVSCENAAVWKEDGTINLHTEDAEGNHLGAWGIRVSDGHDRAAGTTRCYRLDTLLNHAGIVAVDILKVDVEGAEIELFGDGPKPWLDNVELIIVETHDRFRPGSELTVRSALSERFEELPRLGENLYFRRRKALQGLRQR